MRLAITKLINRIMGPPAPVRCGYAFHAPGAPLVPSAVGTGPWSLQECQRPRGHGTPGAVALHCHHPEAALRLVPDHEGWTFCIRCTSYWPHGDPLQEGAAPWRKEAVRA